MKRLGSALSPKHKYLSYAIGIGIGELAISPFLLLLIIVIPSLLDIIVARTISYRMVLSLSKLDKLG